MPVAAPPATGVPEEVRPAAARELVALDIDYRRRAGESPAAADYLARLPGLAHDWLAGALRDTAGAEPASTASGGATVALPDAAPAASWR